jgi:VWFA-related protein
MCPSVEQGCTVAAGASMLLRLLLTLLIIPVWGAPAQSQSQQPPPAPQNQPYTIQANSRVVLTDVTVTDKDGNPVRSLPESAFRIFDNSKPQTVDSFEEHTGTTAAIPMEPAKGVFSNDYLLHPPSALNVVLLDISNLEIADQMYLYYELKKFFNDQAVGQPMAIYLRDGNGCFLVQDFTTDRELLLTALHRAIPRIRPDNTYVTGIDALNQIAGHLSELPGRKNVLWFGGGSTVYLRDNFFVLSDNPDAWRDLCDELEKARIAIYPIDARGLMNISLHLSSLLWAQWAEMNQTAKATGGEAFYNSNGLTEITHRLLSSDNSFYTLTYSPHDLHFDNRWHKVRVALNEKGYQLSYRRGYFADGSTGSSGHLQKTTERTRLLPDGEKVELNGMRNEPIIFQASVLPLSDPAVISTPRPITSAPGPPPRKGGVPFRVRYSLPVNALTQRTIDGKEEVTFRVAAIVIDHYGSPIDSHAEQVTMALNEGAMRLHPDAPLTFDQRLDLKKDDEFLYLAVWDVTSRRIGTLQVPVQVPKPEKRVHAN